MANDENLRVPTSEQAREYGRRGGKASGEARRRKRDNRKIMLDMLNARPKLDRRTLDNLHQLGIYGTGKDKDQYTVEMIINAAVTQKAMRGDIKAYRAILETIGEDVRSRISREMSGYGPGDQDGPLVINYDYGDAEDEDDDQ